MEYREEKKMTAQEAYDMVKADDIERFIETKETLAPLSGKELKMVVVASLSLIGAKDYPELPKFEAAVQSAKDCLRAAEEAKDMKEEFRELLFEDSSGKFDVFAMEGDVIKRKDASGGVYYGVLGSLDLTDSDYNGDDIDDVSAVHEMVQDLADHISEVSVELYGEANVTKGSKRIAEFLFDSVSKAVDAHNKE